jgi:electron-transferring-flavoprotein dehydrogenase
MKSGMLAAQAIFEAVESGSNSVKPLNGYDVLLSNSWLGEELKRSRNFGPAMHKFGALIGGAFNFLDQNIFNGRSPFTLRDKVQDSEKMKTVSASRSRVYDKPDGVVSFDRLSSVFLSNVYHEENQPVHLKLISSSVPIELNLPVYDEPAQRYCPAGVYEIVEGEGAKKSLQINAQNCIHCKTCDIKDPSQNITWVPPEGGGGPNYQNM